VQHRTERVLTPCDSRPEEALSIGAARPPPGEVSALEHDHLRREALRQVVSRRTRVAAALNFDGFGAGRGALDQGGVGAAAGTGPPVPLTAPVEAGSTVGRGSDPLRQVVRALPPLDAAPLGSEPPLRPGPPVGESS